MQYLAIDVGGTTTKYGLVSATGALSQHGQFDRFDSTA